MAYPNTTNNPKKIHSRGPPCPHQHMTPKGRVHEGACGLQRPFKLGASLPSHQTMCPKTFMKPHTCGRWRVMSHQSHAKSFKCPHVLQKYQRYPTCGQIIKEWCQVIWCLQQSHPLHRNIYQVFQQIFIMNGLHQTLEATQVMASHPYHFKM